MTTSIAPTTAPLTAQPATTTTATPAVAPPLPGTTTAPATSTPAPTADALMGALQNLITVLNALVDALKGAQLSGGGPGQSPTQSPVQAPMKVAAGGPAPAMATTPAPTATGGGPTPTTAPATSLQPVTAGYLGPTVGISDTRDIGGSSFVFGSGSGIGVPDGHLQFFGRFGGTTNGGGQNEVVVSGANVDYHRVVYPDNGSITLGDGTTFAWAANIKAGNVSGIQYNEPSFTVTRPGATPVVINSSLDRLPNYDDNLTSPLTSAETAELSAAFAARFPRAT
ncbi:MAG: hypothetical protein JWM98_943 [Thermoleophilia bacterium]|nr:hypothetical protein [Thermoleophilia bacterium]